MATKATLLCDQKRMVTFDAAGGAWVGLTPGAGLAAGAGPPQAARAAPPTARLAIRKKLRRDNDLDIFSPLVDCELVYWKHPARAIKISSQLTSFY